MRHISRIVVHCAATPPSMDIGAKDIDRWHRAKGWLLIGYHFVIRRDGTIEHGRPIERPGVLDPGYNSNSIGICMVGGVYEDDLKEAENNFTPEQFKALRIMLFDFRRDFPDAEILGHRDLPRVVKACPSFDVKEWWALMTTAPRDD